MMPYQLLALDVDGTVLDPEGQIRPAVKQAVADAQAHGLQVILCTGRRFRSALPVAQSLGLTHPLIVHNGALVKAPASGQTLHHCYLSPDVYQQSLALLSLVSSPMLYIDAFHDGIDIITAHSDRTHPFQQAYLQATQKHCQIVTDISNPPLQGVVMMSIMAEESRLQAFRSDVQAALGSLAHINVLANKSYQGSILEILHPSVSKWQALHAFASQRGIAASQIIAVGDDANDLEMIRHAGLGIAMGNAIDAVKAAADYVTLSNAEEGLAHALRHVVLKA
jgi:Cof subfamily protein (haloacid dehalogenase superfamily)